MTASVLLVDDERFARTVYSDYLRTAGYGVEVADDADAALACLRDRRFDVLITDVILPGRDGLELLGQAKQLDPNLEVVVITALDRVAPAVRAMKSGASDYLVKPVAPEALQLAVQRSLANRALLAENKALRAHLKLFESCQRLTAQLDRERLVPAVLTTLSAECGTSAGALFERSGGGRWSVAGAQGLASDAAEGLLEAARPALEGFGREGAISLGRRHLPGMGDREALCLPLSDGAVLRGAVALLVERPLDGERAESAAFICRHTAMALRTLGQLRDAESLAYIDDLTHLYNVRFLDLVLEREIDGGRPFTVLFLDLDQFKLVNDRHGHLVGSHLLVEVGRVLRACVRDDDVLVRFGGDEYVVVLVGIDSGGGLKVAERIRRAIEDHRFLARDGVTVRITASVGLASYPEHARNKEEILDLSDRAMYRGKRTTRNVVYMAAKDLPPVTGR